MYKKLLLLVLMLAFTVFAAGCLSKPKPPANLKGKQITGWEIYQAKKCATCHMINGEGKDRDGDLSQIGKKRDKKYLTKFLTDPRSVVQNGRMPSPRLGPEQVDALVEYLLTLK